MARLINTRLSLLYVCLVNILIFLLIHNVFYLFPVNFRYSCPQDPMTVSKKFLYNLIFVYSVINYFHVFHHQPLFPRRLFFTNSPTERKY